MKLVIAIISDDDCGEVLGALSKNGLSATRLSTTGGFLRSGNSTLLMGVDEDKLDTVFDVLKEHSSSRKQMISVTPPLGAIEFVSPPVEITVGGATVFVVDVEKFVKL